MSNNKGKNNRQSKSNVSAAVDAPSKKENGNSWLKSKYILLLKLILVLSVVLFCIHYTDSKKYFDPDMEMAAHATFKRWESFYKLTEKDSIDILVLGNSHANHSINPKNLSATTGTISFVMAQSGSDISDAYYSLEEALTRTRPKLCVVETYGCVDENYVKKRGRAVSRMKCFSARQNISLKMKSMPDLYEYDDYPAAWSATIRNHEFIFRDTAQINRNILLRKKPYLRKKAAFDTIPLYLGRMLRFQSGLTDSLQNIYKEKGPRIVCTDTSGFSINSQAEYYIRKIADLCKRNDIPLLFLTVPMYYKHLENYELWHNELAKIIDPLQVKWYDMQLDYDSVAYTPDCFENTYDFNQHITYQGSMVTTYKLAHYIQDSMGITLPNRFDDPQWNKLFYGQEGYFFNCAPNDQDTVRHTVARNQKIGDLLVKSLFWEETKQSRKMTLMIQKSESLDKKDTVMLVLKGKVKGHEVWNAHVSAPKVSQIDPLYHNLYIINVIKDFEPDSLISVNLSNK